MSIQPMSTQQAQIHPFPRQPLFVWGRGEQPLSEPSSSLAQISGSREKLAIIIRRQIKRGQHVLLSGEYGSGRTWLLSRIAEEFPDALSLTLSQSKRSMILTVCERLFEDGVLFIDGAEDWIAATKKLKAHTIPQLCALIEEYIPSYHFILDDLDKATEKTVEEIVKPLMEGTVLAAADLSTPAKRKRVQPILDRFKQLDMPPLDPDEARTMLWSQLDRGTIRHATTVEKKILRTAQGVPGVIFDLCEQLRGSGGSLADIREIEHSNSPVRRINLGLPLLFAGIIFLMASRYIFSGFDDRSLFILAGTGSVLASVLLRPLVYKMMQD